MTLEKVKMLNKRYSYDKFIKMVHKPIIDTSKVDELKERISTLKHPVKLGTKMPPGLSVK
jgi:hypothetical protein